MLQLVCEYALVVPALECVITSTLYSGSREALYNSLALHPAIYTDEVDRIQAYIQPLSHVRFCLLYNPAPAPRAFEETVLGLTTWVDCMPDVREW